VARFRFRFRFRPGRFGPTILDSAEMLPEKPQEVPLEDPIDIFPGISACREERSDGDEISDAVEIHRRLLRPVTAVQIGADADMLRVAGDLADVIDVVADLLDLQSEIFRFGTLVRPVVTIMMASKAMPMTAPRSMSTLI